jgi:hypothetical protein
MTKCTICEADITRPLDQFGWASAPTCRGCSDDFGVLIAEAGTAHIFARCPECHYSRLSVASVGPCWRCQDGGGGWIRVDSITKEDRDSARGNRHGRKASHPAAIVATKYIEKVGEMEALLDEAESILEDARDEIRALRDERDELRLALGAALAKEAAA